MRHAYRALAKLYASDLPKGTKRAEKALILGRLRTEVGTRRRINNATLFELESYRGGEEELDRLLVSCDGDFPRLIRSLKRVSKSSFDEPQQRDLAKVIRPLVNSGCPG
jgi:hypothetical protein